MNKFTYEELKQIYENYFSFKGYDVPINNKFALISLICYLVKSLQKNKPDITYYQVIRQLGDQAIPDDIIKGLSIMCEDFSHSRDEFPTFGITNKDVPKEIRKILIGWLPF